MASKTDICNLALTRLGAEHIQDIDEQTKKAITLKAVFDLVRDIVLRDHPWNFAIRRVNLSQLTTYPSSGYAYAYQLPGDCLRVLGMVGPDYDNIDPTLEYKVEGRQLLTTETSVNIKYISRITVVGEFDASFCSALAMRLAAEVAYKITGSAQMKGEMMKEYKMELSAAKSIDAQEDMADIVEEETWLASRF